MVPQPFLRVDAKTVQSTVFASTRKRNDAPQVRYLLRNCGDGGGENQTLTIKKREVPETLDKSLPIK